MTEPISVRVRRPKGLEQLTQIGQPFPTMRDALVFCAALGWSQNQKSEISGKGEGEPIRWEVMINHPGTEPLMDMMSLAATEDVNSLASERFQDRIALFEAYGAGGIGILQGEISRNPTLDLTEIVRGVVQRQVSHGLEDAIIELTSSDLDL